MKRFLLSVLVFLYQGLYAQKECSQWHFGNYAGLNFLTSAPSPLLNSAIQADEGCASIADSLGNLLFYTNGEKIWNKAHVVMANGSGLAGHVSTTQSSLIVKKPGSNHVYYVFTQSEPVFGNAVAYSTVDMSLAAGMGSVIVKNDTLTTSTTEKLCGTMHCNGNDIWVVVHKLNSTAFYAYLVTSSGVNTTPIISSTGSVHNWFQGQMKISPSGKKIATVISGLGGLVELFSFNNSTGLVNSPLVLDTLDGGYGLEFSSDGSKLYASTQLFNTSPPNTTLLQWDLCSGTPSLLIASQTTVGSAMTIGPMQIGIDEKIYVQHSPSTLGSPGQSFYGRIDHPNLSGAACGFSTFTTPLGVVSNNISTPNFISSPFRQKATIGAAVTSCGNASFSAGTPAFCAGVNYSVNSIYWDFGDPASGTTNTSTTQNPSHIYSSNGTYTIQLTVNYDCMSDVITKTISISGFPTLNVNGKLTVCKNDLLVLTATGANTYSWNTGATTASMSATPSVSGLYTVTGTSTAGCSTSKVVSVTVNPCIGLTERSPDTEFLFYPNPATSELNIYSSYNGSLELYNQLGQVVLVKEMKQGSDVLNVADLPKGLYFLKVRTKDISRIQRFVKE